MNEEVSLQMEETVYKHIAVTLVNGMTIKGYNLNFTSDYDAEEEYDSIIFEADNGETAILHSNEIQNITLINDGKQKTMTFDRVYDLNDLV